MCSGAGSLPQAQGLYPNPVWGMDFVSDALFDGHRLRLLTVIDLYTRECLGICEGQNLRSTEVAEMLNHIASHRPLPQLLKTDNSSEFTGKMLDKWVYERSALIFPGREHRWTMPRWNPSTRPYLRLTWSAAERQSGNMCLLGLFSK
jgi:transposase InsO family protein